MKITDIIKLTPDDESFPNRLRQIPDPPAAIYYRGQIPTDNQLTVAIIGSRKHTAYGKATVEAIVEQLVPYQPWIISGLALGLDAIAHQAALKQQLPTLALLPGGVDKVHLATNRQLGHKILEHDGGWLSENPAGTAIRKYQFLRRNRLISGLADCVIVVEAAERSGALSTARSALEQGKELMAVPGPITSPASQGTNRLIQAGAHCLSSPADVPAILDLKPIDSGQRYSYASEDERLIHQALIDNGQQTGDQLIKQLGLERSQYLAAITMLELNGYVFPQGGDLWSAR